MRWLEICTSTVGAWNSALIEQPTASTNKQDRAKKKMRLPRMKYECMATGVGCERREPWREREMEERLGV